MERTISKDLVYGLLRFNCLFRWRLKLLLNHQKDFQFLHIPQKKPQNCGFLMDGVEEII